MTSPRFVLASPALEAPVPPFATARSVPDQSALLIELLIANEPSPRVVLCAAASASSKSAFPAAVRSYVAAAPDPVNCIPLLAADVKPAIAANSAS